MPQWMPFSRDTFRLSAPRIGGPLLIGLSFLIIGILVGREGALKLVELWERFSPHLPFSLPANLPDRIAVSFPTITKLFIVVVSSICAVIMGLLWVIVGLVDALRGFGREADAGDLGNPELVAESLESSTVRQWHAKPLTARTLGLVWPAARSISPVSYGLFTSILGSLWKLAFWAALIAVIAYGLTRLPDGLERLFHRPFTLTVPDPHPLYVLLLIVAATDVILAATLLPLRKRPVDRNTTRIGVRGRVSPNVFFALLEEGCRLLTERGREERRPVRLEKGEPPAKGTLIESFPQPARTFGKPAAYVFLIPAIVLIVAGFSKLIHFDRPTGEMIYTEFFAHHFLDYVLETALGFAMMLAGLHFIEWARAVFDVRTFRSSMIFCKGTTEDGGIDRTGNQRHRLWSGDSKGADGWRVMNGVDEEFAEWVRRPRTVMKMHMEIFWGEVVSEAETAGGPRRLKRVLASESLDRAMERILELPFQVDLSMEVVPSGGPENEKPIQARRPRPAVSQPAQARDSTFRKE